MPWNIEVSPTAALLATLALCLPACGRADSAPADLGRVEVLGSAPGAGLGSGTRYVLSSEDLAASGARTLDQALARVPGLNVRTGAEGVPRIDVRGLRTRHVRLLIDGVPVNTADDGQFDPTLIPVALIDSIVVHTGAASVLYGEGGTGGTIEIVTRRGQGPASGVASASVGDRGLGIGMAQVGASAGAFDYALGVEIAERRGYPVADAFVPTRVQEGGQRVNSDARRRNLVGRLGWQAGDALRLALQWTATQAERGSPPSAIDDAADVFAQRPRYERSEGLDASTVQLSAGWRPTASLDARAWLYANRSRQDDRRYDNAALVLLQDKTLRGGFDLHGDNRIEGGHLQGSLTAAAGVVLSAALDSRREAFAQTGSVRDVAQTGGGGGTGGGKGGGQGGGQGGGAATTTFGLRAVDARHDVHVESVTGDLAWRTSGGLQLGAGGGVVQQRRADGATRVKIASLDARQPLGAALALRAGVSRRARAPSVSQLYDAATGTPTLAMELATAGEIGLAWEPADGPWSGQATLFRNDVRNLIRNDSTTGRAANVDHVIFDGLELQGRWMAGPMLTLEPGYTWLRAANRSPAAAFERLAYTPSQRFTLDARLQAGEHWQIGAGLLHVRDQVFDSRSGATPKQAALPAYTVIGAQVAWRHGPATVTLRVDNLGDENYATSYGFPQPGREASLTVAFVF